METSDVCASACTETIERAKRTAAERRARNDEASRDYDAVPRHDRRAAVPAGRERR